MINKFRRYVIAFFESNKDAVVISAIAAGLHPLLHYYNTNFGQVNSLEQLMFFIGLYLVFPLILFILTKLVFTYVFKSATLGSKVLAVLNTTAFILLLLLSTFGLDMVHTLIGIGVGVLLGLVLQKHIKKVIIFQLLLAGFVFLQLAPDIKKHFTYSNDWMVQSDAIESVKFKSKPNIYLIQPDGYANFSELNNEVYNFDNSEFESFLKTREYKLYSGFRSNYNSTLSSNTSLFAMKHHYYNSPKPKANELYNARNIILGEAPALNTLKSNNYKTFLILESPYLLVNRPKLAFDESNIQYGDIPFLSRGFELKRDVNKDLEAAIMANTSTQNFFFIEKIAPGHIANSKASSAGKDNERRDYLNSLELANQWLMELVELIETKDPNALVIIMADHGGYVGLEHSLQSRQKQDSRDLVYSIFTSALAIKWPENMSPYDEHLKTNVNLFRVLFSSLSENPSHLEHLESDDSYAIIAQGAPFGVYKVINAQGDVCFESYQN